MKNLFYSPIFRCTQIENCAMKCAMNIAVFTTANSNHVR